MRYITYIIVLLFIYQSVAGQNQNTWIVPGQYYYKIKVAETGIYKLTTTDLSQAGVPVSSFSPENVQIWHKGREIPIYISTTSGAINSIEFFGEKNTGWFDIDMYDNPANITNPYHSQINDTSAYFFTWNTSVNNLRYEPVSFNSSNTIAPQSIRQNTIVQYTGRFFNGDEHPVYDEAKGWFDASVITLGGSQTKNIGLPGITYSGTALVEFAVVSFGSAAAEGDNHHLQIEFPGNTIVDTTFYGKTAVKQEISLPASQLDENINVVFRSIDDLDVEADNMAVSFVRFNFPSSVILLDGIIKNFEITSSSQKQIVTIDGLSESQEPIVLDTANQLKLLPEWNGENWQFILPASSQSHKLFVHTSPISPENNAFNAAAMELPANMADDYIIVTHETLSTGAESYSSYRNGTVVTIDELYNNFAYGIEKHPLAIRNFLRYLNEHDGLPEYLFLLGKSVNISSSRVNETYYTQNMVPTMGYPPSDLLMTTKIGSSSLVPQVAVGRYPARTNDQINTFLSKIQELEAQPPAMWMKNMVHFGGGNTEGEQQLFKGYLEGFANIIEDTLMGAHVSTFLKNSSDPIQITASDSIRSLINNGSSLLVFFGHGYSGGFDQDIDEPSAYSNQGKYPLMIANSCYSGNIHLPWNSSVSEEWVMEPNRGAIGFLASVTEAYPSYLNYFSTFFHQHLGYKNYAESLGKIIRGAAQDQLEDSNSQLSDATVLGFAYLGDPALVLNQHEDPDILLTNDKISIDPAEVTTAIDSFAIKFIAGNIGKTISDTIQYGITQVKPDGTDTLYIIERNNLYFQDTITVYIPVDRITGVGLNTFTIRADYSSEIDELNESNNSAELAVNIKSSNLYPVYPYPFAFNAKDTIILRASTGDPFIENLHGIIEIDISPNFNTGAKKRIDQNFEGGVVEWNTGIVADQDQVYYWRVGTENPDGAIEWQNRSFIAEKDKQGWSHSNMDHLAHNNFNFIEIVQDEFVYIDAPKELSAQNKGMPSASQARMVGYDIDGDQETGTCSQADAMLLVVIDSVTLVPWLSNHGDYGHANYPKCWSSTYPNGFFVFRTNEEARDAMTFFMNQIIPEGAYVLAYPYYNSHFEEYSNANFEAFEDLGAELIRGVSNYIPYIFFAQKGFPGTAIEVIGENTTDIINLDVDLKSNFTYGNIATDWLGPAKDWNQISWQFEEGSFEDSDSVLVNIISNSENTKDLVLFDSLPVDASPVDLSQIDASQHPLLKVDFYIEDKVNKTPAQLQKIEALYTPYSDVAISPINHLVFEHDTVQEGESLLFSTAHKNTSDVESPVLSIYYWVTNSSNEVVFTETQEIQAMNEGAFDLDSIEIDTRGMQGRNILWLQYETKNNDFFTFNNLGSLPFYVEGDGSNPLLDVTFDGRHIMNGEIVSAEPIINISLSDDNEYLSLSDTSLFSIYMTYLPEGIERRVYLQPGIDNGTIEWEPATEEQNKAYIIYRPILGDDGLYELRVQARDESNNLSGENDYLIQFEVINKSTITNILNYPNPFSTRTQFVFTLTGSRIPDELSIHIYTISGKMVRVIEESELGPIYIGKNITEYRWDGTDDFGDPLANGVYLYRVYATIDGEKIEMRTTTVDKYFEKGWGKMYLVR